MILNAVGVKLRRNNRLRRLIGKDSNCRIRNAPLKEWTNSAFDNAIGFYTGNSANVLIVEYVAVSNAVLRKIKRIVRKILQGLCMRLEMSRDWLGVFPDSPECREWYKF